MCSIVKLLRLARRTLLPTLLVVTAAVGAWWHFRPSRPLGTWQVADWERAGSSGDGRTAVGLSSKIIPRRFGRRYESPVGPARLLDADSGSEKLRVLSEADLLCLAQLSRDGRWLAVEDRQGGLSVWESDTGRASATLETTRDGGRRDAGYRNFRFAPDGRLLAYEHPDGHAVVLWDTELASPRAALAEACRPFEFAPDGGLLATATTAGAGKLWDRATGRERAILAGGTAINELAFSPDGELLATAHQRPGRDRWHLQEVRLWNLASGELRLTLPVAEASKAKPLEHHPLQFSPDSRMLLMSNLVGDCFFWDITADPPRPLHQLLGQYSVTAGGKTYFESHPRNPIFSADGRWMIVSGDEPGGVKVLDAHSLATTAVLKAGSGEERVEWATFSPNSRNVAVIVYWVGSIEAPRATGWQGLLEWASGWKAPTGSRGFRKTVLFDVPTGRALGIVPGMGDFTANGREIVTSHHDETDTEFILTVQRWSVPSALPFGLYLCVASVAGLLVLVVLRLRGRLCGKGSAGSLLQPAGQSDRV